MLRRFKLAKTCSRKNSTNTKTKSLKISRIEKFSFVQSQWSWSFGCFVCHLPALQPYSIIKCNFFVLSSSVFILKFRIRFVTKFNAHSVTSVALVGCGVCSYANFLFVSTHHGLFLVSLPVHCALNSILLFPSSFHCFNCAGSMNKMNIENILKQKEIICINLIILR